MDFLNEVSPKSGVFYLSKPDNLFENDYITVREKENRVYTDEQVKSLPLLEMGLPNSNEWKRRVKSTRRAVDYFSGSLPNKSNILDLGCGNGWFTSRLASLKGADVIGLDINQTELEQAARVFGATNCRFVYGMIEKVDFKNSRFDAITLNACVQYFDDFKSLVNLLVNLLTADGEIHIIDSPFYEKHEIEAAKARTAAYYQSVDCPGMNTKYFHHSWNDLRYFDYSVLYNPGRIIRKIQGKLGRVDSPFPWIRIRN